MVFAEEKMGGSSEPGKCGGLERMAGPPHIISLHPRSFATEIEAFCFAMNGTPVAPLRRDNRGERRMWKKQSSTRLKRDLNTCRLTPPGKGVNRIMKRRIGSSLLMIALASGSAFFATAQTAQKSTAKTTASSTNTTANRSHRKHRRGHHHKTTGRARKAKSATTAKQQ